MIFSEIERRRISDAIGAAERNTSGEIIAVVTEASDSYFYIPLLWAALIALLAPLPMIYLTKWPVQHMYAIQLALFAAAAAFFQWWPVRVRVVPRAVKRARAHRNALEQFLAQNLHTTEGRTGVLIFISVAEHFAEVIADEGIYRKVSPDIWVEMVDELTSRIKADDAAEGYIEAVRRCGELLAEHFPPGGENSNELPNHLIII